MDVKSKKFKIEVEGMEQLVKMLMERAGEKKVGEKPPGLKNVNVKICRNCFFGIPSMFDCLCIKYDVKCPKLGYAKCKSYKSSKL